MGGVYELRNEISSLIKIYVQKLDIKSHINWKANNHTLNNNFLEPKFFFQKGKLTSAIGNAEY